MKILKFTLAGKNAFFKKPDVNAVLYFTYGNIHKIAIYGIFGAILGYGGYNQMNNYNQINKKDQLVYPEFYDKLKDIKLSIVPNNQNGFFEKKVQYFNNSVGYASKEEGGNLIVKEQWLENPSWDIYILLEENEICKNIEERFLKRKFKYIPYLGKNDHVATITNIDLIENIKEINDVEIIDSMFIKDKFEFSIDFEFDMWNLDNKETEFKYQEKLPYKLEITTNQYILETFIYTNKKVENVSDTKVYNVNNLNLCFI